MKRSLVLFLTVALLLMTGQRLPAQWTIVIDPTETKATAIGGMWGAEDGPAQTDQNTISWSHTINKWSSTLLPDGKI